MNGKENNNTKTQYLTFTKFEAQIFILLFYINNFADNAHCMYRYYRFSASNLSLIGRQTVVLRV